MSTICIYTRVDTNTHSHAHTCKFKAVRASASWNAATHGNALQHTATNHTHTQAGTSFCQLETLNEAYKVGQMRKFKMSSLAQYHLATLASAGVMSHSISVFVSVSICLCLSLCVLVCMYVYVGVCALCVCVCMRSCLYVHCNACKGVATLCFCVCVCVCVCVFASLRACLRTKCHWVTNLENVIFSQYSCVRTKEVCIRKYT